MDFLTAQNRRLAGESLFESVDDARDKNVVIIGGGDTGSDCAGTCIRQGARSVTQFELLPEPPASRAPSTPWPLWPMQLRTSHAHEEGTARDWSVFCEDLLPGVIAERPRRAAAPFADAAQVQRGKAFAQAEAAGVDCDGHGEL